MLLLRHTAGQLCCQTASHLTQRRKAQHRARKIKEYIKEITKSEEAKTALAAVVIPIRGGLMEELQKKYEAAIQLLANQLDTIFTLKARLEMEKRSWPKSRRIIRWTR